MNQLAYVAVRKCCDDGHEWMDLSTVSGLIEYTKTKAEEGSKSVSFSRDNPIVRYATLSLVEEGDSHWLLDTLRNKFPADFDCIVQDNANEIKKLVIELLDRLYRLEN